MTHTIQSEENQTGAIQLGSAAATLVASTGGVLTTYNALGAVTLEPVLGSDMWTVARRDGGRVTRTVPMKRAAARRVFKSLGGAL